VALSRIELIDTALVQIGSEPLQSESAAGAETHILTFESLTGYCLSVNPWHWNTVTRKLVRLADPPPRYWPYQFERPADMLGAPRAYYNSAASREPFTEVELNDGTIQTTAEQLWLKMDRRSPPDTWPAYFVTLIETGLQARFARSIREDNTLASTLEQLAFGNPSENRRGGLMGQALDIDAQAKPSPRIGMGRNPLISARWES
jgi:hypothetical protein